MSNHRFAQHTVIGVHLRAGNGEQAHFVDSGRGIADENKFVSNLVKLVKEFVDISCRPVLLF